MSDGMVFVLHAVADEKYTAELAAALAPATAIASALPEDGARGVQLGGGAASLLIWSSQTNAEAALAALPYAAAICSVRGARVPEALRARALRVVEVAGEPAQDAAQLRDVMAELQAHLRARSLDNSRRRGSVAPRLGGVPVNAQSGDSRKPLLVRSAVGLGATLAVVGVVAPAITNRAQATNMAPENTSESSTAPEVMLTAAPAEVQQAVVENVADDPLMMLTTYNEPRSADRHAALLRAAIDRVRGAL